MRTLDRPRAFNRYTVIGVGGVTICLVAAGLISGYSWVAGSNSAAFIDAGEGWGQGSTAADVLLLVAFGFGIVALLGQLAYSASVIGTIFGGRAVPQEILVYGEEEQEPAGDADE
jgi:hypothetical protein